jgi:Zn-dependent protease/CBS domain-containing protein
MGWSLTIGRIAGTEIRLHFTFLLFLLFIAVSDYAARGAAAALDSIAFLALVFLCVTLHEFGHILMARRFGVRTPEVILSPIGGIANMERIPEKPAQELLVAIAGPLVNVVIALALMGFFGFGLAQLTAINFEKSSLAERLLLVNVTLVVFNLIPAFPMDGGRVLRAILAMLMGPRPATVLSARIGQGFAFLFVLLGLFYNPMLLLIGMFIYFAAASEVQTSTFSSFASQLTVRDAMEPAPLTLSDTSSLSQAIDALLSSPQREFPVVDAASRVVGLLDREAMIEGLRDRGAEVAVGEIMRESRPLAPGQPLIQAFMAMRNGGARAEAVVDPSGRAIGVLTHENIAEMMMIESVRPGFAFTRRPG